ncbi:hypothetical protein GLYMA_12G215450v4 [Glycine max]|nr:hypothetical protein GLYMA_12G215450v4 [Glycine max]KAH1144307.1 hypothetical protein GYH30_034503 [Glycine max]
MLMLMLFTLASTSATPYLVARIKCLSLTWLQELTLLAHLPHPLPVPIPQSLIFFNLIIQSHVDPIMVEIFDGS